MNEVADELDGLAQLRALVASGRKPGMLLALDIVCGTEQGRAMFAGTPGKHAYNPIGTVYGGYVDQLMPPSFLGIKR